MSERLRRIMDVNSLEQCFEPRTVNIMWLDPGDTFLFNAMDALLNRPPHWVVCEVGEFTSDRPGLYATIQSADGTPLVTSWMPPVHMVRPPIGWWHPELKEWPPRGPWPVCYTFGCRKWCTHGDASGIGYCAEHAKCSIHAAKGGVRTVDRFKHPKTYFNSEFLAWQGLEL